MNKTLSMLIFALVAASLWLSSLSAAAGLAASPLTQVTITGKGDQLFGDTTTQYYTSTHKISCSSAYMLTNGAPIKCALFVLEGKDDPVYLAINQEALLNKQSTQIVQGNAGHVSKGRIVEDFPFVTLRVYQALAVDGVVTTLAAKLVTPTVDISIYYNATVHPQVEDTSPPHTAFAAMGPIGTFGRYSGPVTISLAPDDPDGVGDVSTTYYKVDSEPEHLYTDPFVVSTHALHTVSYWSTDKSGNIEDVQERSIWIGADFIRPAPVSIFTYSSEWDDLLGQGKHAELFPPSYLLTPHVYRNFTGSGPRLIGVVTTAKSPGEWWYADFSTSSPLRPLVPGVFDDAQQYTYDGEGRFALNIFSNVRGTNQTNGRFTIIDAVCDESGPDILLQSFGASFELHSQGSAQALYGAVFYNSKAVPIYPKQLTLQADSLLPGGTMTATVTLSDPAPAGGQLVTLSCNQPATVPASVVVPANSRTATFVVSLPASASGIPAINVRARCGEITTVSYFHVIATNYLASISLPQPEHFGAGRTSGTVASAAPAGAGGMLVSLASDNSHVVVPATVRIPEGKSTIAFTAIYNAPLVEQVVTLSGMQGDTTVRTAFVVEPYKPVIASLSPFGCNVGSGTVPVTITGSHFANDDTVMLSGKPVTCQVLSDSTISFEIASGLLQAVGILPVTVVNNNGAGASNVVNFIVNAPTPVITSVTPMTYAPGDAAVFLEVYGDNFMPNTYIKLNGKPVKSWLMAANRLETTLNTDLQRTPSVTVTVSTPAPGGGESNAVVINNVAVKSFDRGLSLISVPADYSAMAISDVFGYPEPKLAVWLPGVNAYQVTPTGAANSLVPGRGYWIRFPHTINIVAAGTPTPTAAAFKIALSAGWNMIGDPFPKTVPLSSSTITIDGADQSFDTASAAHLVGTAFSYDAASNKYVTATSLSPYVGYWLYAGKDCVLSISAP
ncbi:MAG TPA: IPT/TIG domain-containing protein [Capsulimonadaceae bacterium]|jgi:hypothetical protein